MYQDEIQRLRVKSEHIKGEYDMTEKQVVRLLRRIPRSVREEISRMTGRFTSSARRLAPALLDRPDKALAAADLARRRAQFAVAHADPEVRALGLPLLALEQALIYSARGRTQ